MGLNFISEEVKQGQPMRIYWGFSIQGKIVSKKYVKPTLQGGTQPPEGMTWKIYAVPQHSASVIGALARYRGVHPSDVLNSILNFYRNHYSDEINRAFEGHKDHRPDSEVSL